MNMLEVKTSQDLQLLSDSEVLRWAYLNSPVYNRIIHAASRKEGDDEQRQDFVVAKLIIAIKDCEDALVRQVMEQQPKAA